MKKQILLLLFLVFFTSNSFAGLARVPIDKATSNIKKIEDQLYQLSLIIKEQNCDEKNTGTENQEIKNLKESLASLKKLIIGSPESAVNLVLVQRDIDLLKKENKMLREQISSVSGIGKWFIGLLITVILGVFGLLMPFSFNKR